MLDHPFVYKPPLGWPLDCTAPLRQGLVALYALNEGAGATVYDAATGLNGSINGALSWAPATPGTTLAGFAGGATTGTYIDCGNSAALNPAGAMSMAAWVYATGTSANNENWVIGRDDNAAGRSYAFGFASTTNFLTYLQVNGTSVFHSTLFTFAFNTWFHVGVSGSPAVGWVYYYNGNPVASAAWVAPVSSTAHTNIGRRSYAANQDGFIGSLAWTGIWNRALSPAEHLAIGQSPNAIWRHLYLPPRTRAVRVSSPAFGPLRSPPVVGAVRDARRRIAATRRPPPWGFRPSTQAGRLLPWRIAAGPRSRLPRRPAPNVHHPYTQAGPLLPWRIIDGRDRRRRLLAASRPMPAWLWRLLAAHIPAPLQAAMVQEPGDARRRLVAAIRRRPGWINRFVAATAAMAPTGRTDPDAATLAMILAGDPRAAITEPDAATLVAILSS